MVAVDLKRQGNMKKLNADDAVIYIFAHQYKDKTVELPDVLVYVVDMYCKYRTDDFLLEKHSYRYTSNGSFYVRTKCNLVDELLTYSEKYINFLEIVKRIDDIDNKLQEIKHVLDYERPCNQEDGFALFKKQVIPILLFGFYKD